MPFLLLIIGIVVALSAVKGTYTQLGQQVVLDVKGSAGNPGYLYWVSSLVIVGALGYYPPATRFSRAFMILILLGMVLAAYSKNSNLFSNIASALQNPQEPQAQNTASNAQQGNSQQAGLQSGMQTLSTATTALEAASVILV